ncbi:MAG: tRNA (guanosine(46)-N7)-methyltransferase TrmB [Gammaproteobacteria bacterium]|nr:tRNA (guanosine(46)-N7)-methyltransferase TrmB [Gammaproteobacteria bacterium]
MNTEKPFRAIKSFVRREGRLTVGQQKALDTGWSEFGLSLENGPLNLAHTFGRQAPCILEIGFGMGRSLAEMALAQPENDYIGIEVHRPGVGCLLKDIIEQQIPNIRIYDQDAVEVLKQCIPDHSLAGLQLFFPDPWHKKRHNKRRLVQAEFVKLVLQKLQPGGFFHLATDWEHYALQMMEVLSAEPGFSNAAGANEFAQRPISRPLTKFEQRGQRLGHGVWDLLFEKQS